MFFAWAAHKQQIYKAARDNPTTVTRHPSPSLGVSVKTELYRNPEPEPWTSTNSKEKLPFNKEETLSRTRLVWKEASC